MYERATFFDEQARYRRALWRWTIVSAVAVAVMGLPLSLVLTPAVYLATLVVLHFVGRIITVAALVPAALEAANREPRAVLDVMLPAAPVLVAPGAIAILIVWHGVRRLLESVGIEATRPALWVNEQIAPNLALVIFFPLLLVMAYLMLALVAFVTVLAMAAMGVVLAVIHQIFVLLR